MKLKKLLLYGFKSFADKTTLQFQPGLTAIVGPNGCGKSNIVDALRWVMGETQAKAIRGEKMFDVLFNGTKTRPKTSYAEVSLVFDEINGALAVPYDEVMITRRLFSDGSSNYYLNKKEIRLKDLHALFANTGIGKNAFWVFEQGKIDQIVTMSPAELRTIFEDAAGISLYLFQKKEAKGRLKEVEQNLLRAEDRIQEKEKFIALLNKQREDALLWKATKESLEAHEKGYFHKRLASFDSKLEEIQISRASTKAGVEEKERQHGELQTVLKLEENALSNLSQEKEHRKELLFEAKKQLSILQGKKEYLQEQLHEKEKRKTSLEQTLASFEKELIKFSETHPQELQKLQLSTQEIHLLQTQLEHLKTSVKTLEHDVLEISTRERKEQDLHFSLQKSLQKAQFDEKSLHLKRESSTKEMNEYRERLESIRSTLGKRTEKKLALQEELNLVKTAFEELKIFLKSQVEALNTSEKNLSQQDQKIQVEIRKITELKTKINSLNSLRSELEGSSTGTKELYQQSKDPKSPLFEKLKALSDLLDIESDWAEAAACALHPYAHTLVVENKYDLQLAIDFIQSRNLTNISLVCKEFIDSPSQNGTLAAFCNPQEFSSHFFGEISIIDSPLHSAKTPAWTKDGFFITSKNLITKTKIGDHHAFLRQGEVKKLLKEMEIFEQKRDFLENERKNLLLEKEQKIALIKEQENLLKQKETKLMELKFHLQNESESLRKDEEQQIHLTKKYELLETASSSFDEQQTKIKAELSSLEQKISICKDKFDEYKNKLESSREGLSAKKSILQTEERLYYSKLSLKNKLESEIHSASFRNEQQLEQKTRYLPELQETILFLAKTTLEFKTVSESIEKLLSSLVILEEDFSHSNTLFNNASSKVKEIKISSEQLFSSLQKVKELLNGIEMKFFEQTTKKGALLTELEEKYGLIELIAPPFDLSFDKYELKIKEFRALLASLPSINLLAQEEYATEEQELLTLQAQIADLKGSLTEVVNLIQELDQKSSALFQETFVVVERNFRENFQRLFNGGHAELILKQSSDLLEAEVEIRCEPPGKSLKSLQLLSGGEKCLTAIALLFALFQVKPAPMCLLDEIDAPLDESNAKRFLDLIEPFSHQTKILLVTHNKLTMEKAHQIIGISMQEKGVTKALDLFGIQQEAKEQASIS